MNKASVRIQLAHVQQRVIGEDVGQVKTAERHVMGSAAEFELIEFIDRSEAPIVAFENGIFKFGRAIIRTEIEAKTLFRKIRESAAILLYAAVLMKTWLPVRPQPFDRGFYFGRPIHGSRGREGYAWHIQQTGADLRRVGRIARDVGIHDRRRNNVAQEE